MTRIGNPATARIETGPNIVGPREGYSLQIGTLVSILEWMRRAVLESVQGLAMTIWITSTTLRLTVSALSYCTSRPEKARRTIKGNELSY